MIKCDEASKFIAENQNLKFLKLKYCEMKAKGWETVIDSCRQYNLNLL